jgi:hypothetical protein
MEKKVQKIITQIALAASVVLLQVLSMRLNYYYTQSLEALEHGLKNAGITLLMEILSLLSGIVLVWLPGIRPLKGESRKELNIGLLLLLIFTLLLMIIKVFILGFSWAGPFFIPLLPPYKPFGSWVLETQVPSLLAGFSLGKLLRR